MPAMQHEAQIVVRYSETDQMKVVYYAHYFVWMEQARTEILEKMGLAYHKLEEQGYFLPVLEAHAHYMKPARYGDRVCVSARFSSEGVRIRVDYDIRRGQDLLATGHTLHVFTDAGHKPTRPPKDFLNLLKSGSKPGV